MGDSHGWKYEIKRANGPQIDVAATLNCQCVLVPER